jgi:hypothetical protein
MAREKRGRMEKGRMENRIYVDLQINTFSVMQTGPFEHLAVK